MKFKESYIFEQRLAESKRIMNKYPGLNPVILNISNDSMFRSIDLPNLDKFKYLVPSGISMSQFIFIVRRKMHLEEHVAIYFLINGNTIPIMSDLMSVIYNKYKDPDGFLYLSIIPENFFGSLQQTV